MEIQQLRNLVAAAEFGNIRKAAAELHISQSGLSRSLKNLEDRLGVPLLSRGPKGVEPTPYGLALLRRARVILNETARCVDEVHEIKHGLVGETHFGVTQNYANYLMPDVLARLHVERPLLRVTVISDGFLELIEKLQTEQIDFLFGLIGRIHDSRELRIEPLTENRSTVFARPGHPLASKRGVETDDLSSADWAMLSSESVQRAFELFFERRGRATPHQVLKCNSIAMLRHVVAETDVLTILPHEVVQPETQAGMLVAIDCETPVERTRIGLVFRKGTPITPQAQAVVDAIRDAVAGRAPSAKNSDQLEVA